MNAAPASRILEFEAAQAVVREHCGAMRPKGSEEVSILESLGRILAEPLIADRDFPPFPRATRDGYALRSADLQSVPAALRIVGQVRAGASFTEQINPGEAVEIMTGAPVPAGADAVLMVEHASCSNSQLRAARSVTRGENIVQTGSEARAGQEIVCSGTRVQPAHIAVAAACGRERVRVFFRPKVAILATGDELVSINQKPNPSQIRNTNSYSLAAQVVLAGGTPWLMPVAADQESSLRTLIEQALSADLLLLSGGVSMGKFDLVEQVMASLGAEFVFTGALIQPGKPVVFGYFPGGPRFFGLPGNPVSTMVTFDLFARPVVEALAGLSSVRLTTARARLSNEVRTKTGLTRFLPAILAGSALDPEVRTVTWQGSGDLMAAAKANCYLIVPPDRDSLAAGEMVAVLLRSCPE